MKIHGSIFFAVCVVKLLAFVHPTHADVPEQDFTSTEKAVSPPLVISGQSNVWIQNVRITNPNGPCILIQNGSKNVQVINSELGPCSGGGIEIKGSSVIKVNNVSIHDAKGNGVQVSTSTNVKIEQNTIIGGQSQVYVYSSSGIQVLKNSFLNAQGPRPRGNFVQFNAVSGGGNRISCNTGVDLPNLSVPEDHINLYQSNGLASDPIQIVGNKIYGGGPSTSGGGIILGDGSGSYQMAKDNALVNPGQYGVSVAGGHHMQLLNNRVFSQSFPYNNIGLYVWNQYTPPCSAITVQGNKVNYKNKNNQSNGGWNGGNCGTITGWSDNNFNDPSVTEAVFRDFTSSECQ